MRVKLASVIEFESTSPFGVNRNTDDVNKRIRSITFIPVIVSKYSNICGCARPLTLLGRIHTSGSPP